jgi:hypothetical protein
MYLYYLLHFLFYFQLQVAVGHQYVAGFLHIGPEAIAHRLHQVKEKFLSFRHLLPYGNTINAKNVFSHARAIARMSNVLEQQSTAAAAAAEPGRAAGVVAVAKGDKNAEDLGPASKALAESQKPALEAAKLEAKIPKDYSKRRKRVRFEQQEEEEEKKEPKSLEAVTELSGDDVDELGTDLDASDSELDMYLRSAEEVEAFKEAYEALEGVVAAGKSG